MADKSLQSEINKVWIYTKALRLGELFSGPTGLEASAGFKSIAARIDISYEELYLAGLQGSQYNILLRDFSFFQFGSSGADDVRFAYYPNPFLGAAADAVAELTEMQEYVAEGILEIDELLHRISEIRRPQHPPLIRYEYAKAQYDDQKHPCSHVHLGFHSHNRLPVRRRFTAHAFSLMIFRLFYLDFWLDADTVKYGSSELNMDAVLSAARAECRMLYEDEFSEGEGQRFHLV